jgi:cobalt/nickel transport system permease protein
MIRASMRPASRSLHTLAVIALAFAIAPNRARAMHLADGVLPANWCMIWMLVALPFVVLGLRRVDLRQARDARAIPLLAMVGAAVFAISCMPIPVPFVGTCSHPCGTGLAAILVGPLLTVLITFVALVLQALFLAHGGVTTLGADVLSMGIAGGFVGYAIYTLARRMGASLWTAAFLAGLLSDWATYATTALELALGLSGGTSIAHLFALVAAAFAPTQIPLGILEGVVSAQAITFVCRRRPDLLAHLWPRAEPVS